MKHCTKCEFFKEDFQKHPSGQLLKALVCLHKECSDPVDGSPIPCSISRRESGLCGLIGKYYKEKEKQEQTSDEKVIKIIT